MHLILAMLAGIILYLGLNLGILRKPLTIGYIRTAYDFKQAYADSVRVPKIVVVGGSSNLFGVRCETIAAETGMPCVNMAVTAGIGIDLILAKADPAIRPGDVLLIPAEYDFYHMDGEIIANNSVANQYVVTYEPALLSRFDLHRRAAALLSLSLQDVYTSAVEMALQAHGFQRRFTISQLTTQGDLSGHTLTKAADYTAYLAGLQGAVAVAPDPQSEGMRLIADFVAGHRANGVRVFSAFPPTIDDGPVQLAGYDAIRSWWQTNSDGFLETPNLARYPRDQFFDTHYHLAEPAQIQHSRRLGQALKARL